MPTAPSSSPTTSRGRRGEVSGDELVLVFLRLIRSLHNIIKTVQIYMHGVIRLVIRMLPG